MYEKPYLSLSDRTASRSEVELSETMTFGTTSWQSKTDRKHSSRNSGRFRVEITIVSSSEIIAVVSLTGRVALGSSRARENCDLSTMLKFRGRHREEESSFSRLAERALWWA